MLLSNTVNRDLAFHFMLNSGLKFIKQWNYLTVLNEIAKFIE